MSKSVFREKYFKMTSTEILPSMLSVKKLVCTFLQLYHRQSLSHRGTVRHPSVHMFSCKQFFIIPSPPRPLVRFLNLVLDVPLVVQLCIPKFGSDPLTNMAAVCHFGFFSLLDLLHNQGGNFVKNLHMDSSQPVDVSPQK